MEKVTYDFINEEYLEQMERKMSSRDYTKLVEEAAFSGSFAVSYKEFLVIEHLQKEHKSCRVNEDGTHKFGVIGGGSSVIFRFRPEDKYVLYKCDGCDTEYNVTELANDVPDMMYNKTEDEHKEHIESMSMVEYMRLRQFITDHVKDGYTLDVSFMPTGLGSIITVSCKEADVCANITEFEAW